MSTPLRSRRQVPPAVKSKAATKDEVVTGCVTALLMVVMTSAFMTVAWNYGVSEILQAYGAGDHNIDIVTAFFVVIFANLVVRGVQSNKR